MRSIFTEDSSSNSRAPVLALLLSLLDVIVTPLCIIFIAKTMQINVKYILKVF